MDSKIIEEFKQNIYKTLQGNVFHLYLFFEGKTDNSLEWEHSNYYRKIELLIDTVVNYYLEHKSKIILDYLASLNTSVSSVICYIISHKTNDVNLDYLYNFNFETNLETSYFHMNYDPENVDLYDIYKYVISKNNKIISLEEEIEILEEEIKKLKEENEKLKTEVLYQPGGKGMLDAKSNFETIAKK